MKIKTAVVVVLVTLGMLASVPPNVGASVANKSRLPASCDNELRAESKLVATFEETVGNVGDDQSFGAIGQVLDAVDRGESAENEEGQLDTVLGRLFASYDASFGRSLDKCDKVLKRSHATALNPCGAAIDAALALADEVDNVFGATETDFGLYGAVIDAFDRDESGNPERTQMYESINKGLDAGANFYNSSDRCYARNASRNGTTPATVCTTITDASNNIEICRPA